jgi:hypothetical protein
MRGETSGILAREKPRRIGFAGREIDQRLDRAVQCALRGAITHAFANVAQQPFINIV